MVMVRALAALSLVVGGVAAPALAPADEAARSCLLGEGGCDDGAACPGSGNYSRACLSLRVPWQTPYARVRCCLRCCLTHWVERLGLGANFRANAEGRFEGSARADEMMLGFGIESTMGFAALRKSLKGTGGKEALADGALWRPEVAAPGGLAPRWGAAAWVDVAFGDGCGSFAGYHFEVARRRHLEQLGPLLDRHRMALVTTDDCDAPDSAAADALLAHENLTAWFHSNPKVGASSPKLRAFPIGAHRRNHFAPALERGEARGAPRDATLACCCMAALPPPGAADADYPGLRAPASFKGMRPETAAKLTDLDLLLGSGPDGLARLQKSVHSSVAMVLKRVRRTAVIDALKRNNFTTCSYGALQGSHDGDGHDDYVRNLLEARFVASPQGNGRACHRDWEALYAGAVPVLDWDASQHMAALYDGLPVLRVKDWRDVTRPLLDAYWAHLDAHRDDLDVAKLYMPYWIRKLTAHAFPGEAP